MTLAKLKLSKWVKASRWYISGLLVVIALGLSELLLNGHHPSVVIPQRLSSIVTAVSTPAPAPASVPYPRLSIPSLSVLAPIQAVGLTPGGAMAVPKSAAAVGWYKLGAAPGSKGSAVIDGHIRTSNGSAGVFQNLAKLQIGDKISVEKSQGNVISFTIRQKRSYSPDDRPSEVFNKTDGTYLNLITCEGTWDKTRKTYTNRLVVFASASN